MDRPQRDQRAGTATGCEAPRRCPHRATGVAGAEGRRFPRRLSQPCRHRVEGDPATRPPAGQHHPAARQGGSGPVPRARRRRRRRPAQLGPVSLVTRAGSLGRAGHPGRADTRSLPAPGRAWPARPRALPEPRAGDGVTQGQVRTVHRPVAGTGRIRTCNRAGPGGPRAGGGARADAGQP